MLIAGGFNESYLSDAEIYDPSTGEFSPTGSLNVARMDHVAVLLDNGKVLLVGGVGTGWTFLASAEIYDPAINAFRKPADMPTVRYKHIGTSLLLKNDKALIAVGARNAVVHDPLTNVFSSIPGDLGTNVLSRLFSTATLLQDGSVLITGGYGVNQNVSAQAWVFRY